MMPNNSTQENNSYPQTYQPVYQQDYNQPYLPPQTTVKKDFINSFKKFLRPPFSYIGMGLVLVVLIMIVLAILAKPKPTVIIDDGKSKEITLKLWSFTENNSHYQKLIDDYQSQNSNVKITFEQRNPSDYKSILEQRIQENSNIPDIFEIDSKDVNLYKNYLTPAPDSILTIDDYSKMYYPQIQSDNILGGSILGIPNGIDGLMLAYNETLINKSEIPIYWSEFTKFATSKTEKNEKDSSKNSINGIAASSSEKMLYLDEIAQMLIFQNKQKTFIDNSTGLANIDSKSAVEAINLYQKIVSQQPWDQQQIDSIEAFIEGKTAFAIIKAKDLYYIKNKNPNLKFSTTQMPIINDQVYMSSYNSFVVSNYTTNSNEAWKFLKFISSEDSVQYLYSTAEENKLAKKPYALRSLIFKLKDDPLLAPIGVMAPNMINWPTIDKTATNKIFSEMMINFSGSEITPDEIERLNSNLNSVTTTF
ncbi:MAG: extracellular solute-binding protein [bacterium]